MKHRFDSEKWKADVNAQYDMLDDIVNSQTLFGKSKDEIVSLLDTTGIKQFNYSEDSWAYIISIPDFVPVTKSPVQIMNVYFKEGRVTNVELRK